ncbi:WAT1-related protein At1g68170 isoform X1 [Medicago truncatula]|uniref:WAT1-related protein At1g68170 isoform X1 n=1 Tax=Medicago truncatula TaxID=3880 RepID=UPI000D2F17C6|nr:WAT1-related protein At1g68170-like isoform X1 [Medicago truncatula]
MKEVCNSLQGLKPVIVMVFVQIAYAAMNIMCKLVINDGMSMRVATAYRLICASAFTIPVALFFDRRKRPKITWKVLFMAFLSGLFGGSLFINLYAEGIALTSATFMLAMFNLTPGITFIMAILFGLEKLNWSLAEGKAKVMGTAIGISGAMLMTFYNGAEINIRSSNINLLHAHQNQNGHMEPQHADFSNKLLGVLCAIGSSCFFSLWFIIQAKMNKEYPSHHSSTALMSTMGAIQAIVFAICVDRDLTQWKLGYNIRLLMVAYSGIVISGIATIVIAWCIKMRGPLFASVFYPLQLLLVAVSAYLLLDEKLYLGSILGAVLIVCGLYIVLWSKNKEMKEKVQVTSMAGPTYSEA